MATVRWKLVDTETSDEVFLPINPNDASPVDQGRNWTFAWGSYFGHDRMRVMEMPQQGAEWTFGGVILTQAHYELLEEWASRSSILRVTDHFDRTFEIMIRQFDPIERRPTATKPWRADYTMTCLLLKEVTA